MTEQNGKRSGRGGCIFRAIRLLQMFQSRREVTVRNIMDEFGITKQAAQVWLDEMSRVYPVLERREETIVLNNSVRGRTKRKFYGLME